MPVTIQHQNHPAPLQTIHQQQAFLKETARAPGLLANAPNPSATFFITGTKLDASVFKISIPAAPNESPAKKPPMPAPISKHTKTCFH